MLVSYFDYYWNSNFLPNVANACCCLVVNSDPNDFMSWKHCAMLDIICSTAWLLLLCMSPMLIVFTCFSLLACWTASIMRFGASGKIRPISSVEKPCSIKWWILFLITELGCLCMLIVLALEQFGACFAFQKI